MRRERALLQLPVDTIASRLLLLLRFSTSTLYNIRLTTLRKIYSNGKSLVNIFLMFSFMCVLLDIRAMNASSLRVYDNMFVI